MGLNAKDDELSSISSDVLSDSSDEDSKGKFNKDEMKKNN